jgi:hypothetical protein
MGRSFWDALAGLPLPNKVFFAVALAVAFGFEFINGFHDTANVVTTVIYTRTLKPTFAVLYSGIMNFLGVLLGGTAVAFSIVNLLPVDLLIESASVRSVVMVLSLLLAGVIWNLATWWFGLLVSSSHTLIGSILGVGLVNSLLTRGDVRGVNRPRSCSPPPCSASAASSSPPHVPMPSPPSGQRHPRRSARYRGWSTGPHPEPTGGTGSRAPRRPWRRDPVADRDRLAPYLHVSSGPLRPAAGGHGLDAGPPPIRRRGSRFGLTEGAHEEVVAAPGDGEQPPPVGQRTVPLQLVV